MRYKGTVFWSEEPWKNLEGLNDLDDLDGLEDSGRIEMAFLTPTKVTIDWVDHEGRFGLVARSEDGRVFRGEYAEYGDKRLDSRFTISLKLVKVAASEVLMGNWLNNYTQVEGGLAFRLRPDDEDK